MIDNLDVLLKNTGDLSLKRRAKWIIEYLNPKQGERILDLGCGDGFYLYLLSNLNLNLDLYGADYDKIALTSAKRNLDKKQIKFVQTDLLNKLPFSDDHFDGIVMSEVLEHLQDDILGLKEVKRVLKKRGKIVLSVPNIDYPFLWDPVNWLLQRIFKTHIKSGFWAGIWNQHNRLYSDMLLKLVLRKGGFRNIKIEKITHYCIPFNHYLINLVARILVYKKTPKIFKSKLSKFNAKEQNKERSFNPFWILSRFDSMNDYWKGAGSAVSLVAVASK